MNVLFIHPNFPAQFLYLSMYFAQELGHNVVYLTNNTNNNSISKVQLAVYKRDEWPFKEGGPQPKIKLYEEAVMDGVAVARALIELRDTHKYKPDIIVAHTGWGSTLFAKDIYPEVPLVGYFEWYYKSRGSDVCFWKDEQLPPGEAMRIRMLNSHHLVNLIHTDVRFTPTKWQRDQFPEEFRDTIEVVHEGVDVEFCSPDHNAKMVVPKKELDLSDVEQCITYVSRGFEPYRGFPQFMDAIRIVLKERPNVHVVIIGQDQVCYGAKHRTGKGYKVVEEEKGGYDKERVHFIGHATRDVYQQVLRASTVHVYLTRPFVLSWSMLEAMSFECALVASATPPVEEVVTDNVNGLLASFREPKHIASRIMELLDDKELRTRLGKAARELMVQKYDRRDLTKKQANLVYKALNLPLDKIKR